MDADLFCLIDTYQPPKHSQCGCDGNFALFHQLHEFPEFHRGSAGIVFYKVFFNIVFDYFWILVGLRVVMNIFDFFCVTHLKFYMEEKYSIYEVFNKKTYFLHNLKIKIIKINILF